MTECMAATGYGEMSALQTSQAGGVEDGDDGHGVDDLTLQDHLESIGEGEGLDLDELRVIRRPLQPGQLLPDEEVGGLVHHALACVKTAQPGEPSRPVPALLTQLPLGCRLDRLARMDPSGRHLPSDALRDIPVLLHEQNRVAVEKGEDADTLAAGDHAVNRGPSVREPDEVFAQGQPFVLIDRPAGEG